MRSVLDSIVTPHDWGRVPFGRLVERSRRAGRPDLPPLSVFLDEGVVPRSSRTDNYNRLGSNLAKYLVVRPGDVVFNKLRTWQGGLGVSRYTGIVSPAYFVCRPSRRVEPRYLHYLLRSNAYLAELTRVSKFMPPSQFDILWDDLRLLPILVPRSEAQAAIADYLDTETSRIDTLITKKRRMIQLLQQRWQAEVMSTIYGDRSIRQGAIRYIVDLQPGYAFPSSDFVAEGIRLLRGANIAPGRLRWESDVVCVPSEDRIALSDYELSVGDVVLGMDRPFIGTGTRVATVTESDLPCLLVQRVARIRATEHSDARYIRLLMESDAFVTHLTPVFTGVSVPHVSAEQILSFRAPLPSRDAQRTVATRLERRRTDLSEAADLITTQINLLAERRQALITAAVTGELRISGGAG